VDKRIRTRSKERRLRIIAELLKNAPVLLKRFLKRGLWWERYLPDKKGTIGSLFQQIETHRLPKTMGRAALHILRQIG